MPWRRLVMEPMHGNVLIEASAGSGKTQALAERLVELRRSGVKTHEIVALTFSRAAAGEIFERFVTLLAKSAAEDPQAEEMLRDTIASQHLCAVGTLDGFLLRTAKSFPQELGIVGDVEMMDDFEAASERAKVSFSVLRRTDRASKRAFSDAFALAVGGESVRAFADAYKRFVGAWHELFLSHRERSAWGDPSALQGMPDSLDAFGEAALADAADAVLAAPLPGSADKWREFAEWVRAFRGSFEGGAKKGYAKKLLDISEPFAGPVVEFSFGRTASPIVLGGGDARRVRAALAAVAGYCVRRRMETARGIFTLMSRYEDAYARAVRGKGRLVFGDIPRLVASLGEDVRMSLEYRLDMRLRAWALDEFQDTSREQWSALERLVEEAKQSAGEKSVFVVGDCKQAIYGWRNGDVRIFRRERDSGEYDVRELNKSWRFAPAVTEAVNRVFAPGGMLSAEFPAWHSPIHETAKANAGLAGFVQVVDGSPSAPEDFVAPVYNALAAVDPVGRGISAAVLVRTNDLGELIAAELRRRGMEGVVWEGESSVLDTPALVAFVDLVALADHPGDGQSYLHFLSTPLCRAKYPNGAPSAAALSAELAREFAERGLVRTFRGLRALMPQDPSEAWSEFTEGRFTDMLRAAAEFELGAGPGTRLADFEAYLASRKTRSIAEAGKVKVMTIHRSKGLGFDYVVLPLYEHDGLRTEPKGPLVADGWVMPDPGAFAGKAFPAIAAARRERADRAEQEALCAYYVAMTRAKRAMTIVPHTASDRTLRFSDLVRASIRGEIGDREWYLKAGSGGKRADGADAAGEVLPKRGPRDGFVRRMPSLSLRSGMSAGGLFAAKDARRSAMERGTVRHAEFEKIEWLAPEDAKTDLERELTRPADAVELWRERSYELCLDGAWETGQFDRVVFSGHGAARRAVIYDFKTNAKRADENDAAFADRMRAAYASQMRSYRRALAALTCLPSEAITSVLLLTATGACVEVV